MSSLHAAGLDWQSLSRCALNRASALKRDDRQGFDTMRQGFDGCQGFDGWVWEMTAAEALAAFGPVVLSEGEGEGERDAWEREEGG